MSRNKKENDVPKEAATKKRKRDKKMEVDDKLQVRTKCGALTVEDGDAYEARILFLARRGWRTIL